MPVNARKKKEKRLVLLKIEVLPCQALIHREIYDHFRTLCSCSKEDKNVIYKEDMTRQRTRRRSVIWLNFAFIDQLNKVQTPDFFS